MKGNTMLQINGKLYVKNNAEFTETLFRKGGTAYGYYKKLNGSIHLMDMHKNVFAAVVINKHDFKGIVNAKRLDNGKVFYQYGLSDENKKLLGVPESYIAEREYANEIFNREGL